MPERYKGAICLTDAGKGFKADVTLEFSPTDLPQPTIDQSTRHQNVLIGNVTHMLIEHEIGDTFLEREEISNKMINQSIPETIFEFSDKVNTN